METTTSRWIIGLALGTWAVLSSGCSYLPWHRATPAATADWCADAALFSMHSVRHHEQGTSYGDMDHDLDASDVSYLQLYPALSTPDMHRLLHDVSTHKRTRFAAAKAVVDACDARNHTPAPTYAPDYLRQPHSDEWCGQAMDFAMGMAGYRDLGFPEKQMEASLHDDPLWLDEIFPALRTPDRVSLVRAVYTQKWSRYAAADALGHACKVAAPANGAQP